MSSLSDSEAKEFHSAYVTGTSRLCGHRDRCTLLALRVEALVLRTKEPLVHSVWPKNHRRIINVTETILCTDSGCYLIHAKS